MANVSARKRIATGIAAVLGGKISVPKRPRPYQRDALAAVGNWLKKTTEPRAHVAHATGLGKTVLFSSVAAAIGKDRLLVVVPTKALLVQTARVLSGFSDGQIGHVSSLGRINDGDGETIATRGIAGSQIVVTTNASLRLKGEQIAREFDPQLLVYDECHWSYTDEIQGALGNFGDTPMLGVTATPDFMGTAARAGYVPVTLDNGQVLWGPRERFAETYFGRRLDERAVRWGIEEGWLAPLAWGRIEFDISLDDLRTQDGIAGADYNEQDLHDLLSRNWSAMVDTIRRLYRSGQYELAKRQVFSVCHSVDAARELADAIQGVGVPSAVVVGTTDDDERDDILTRYRRDRIRFLSSVMVLREGWDSPNAEVCMMLRPTKSRVLYQQVMGRVLRKLDGRRKVALVLDARFQNTEFSPLSTPILFGRPGSEIAEGDIILGPRKGGGGRRGDEGSPYLPKGAKPRLVVVDAIGEGDGILHSADDMGRILIGGEVYLHQRPISVQLKVGLEVVNALVAQGPVRSIRGLGRNGKLIAFHCLSDVQRCYAEQLGGRFLVSEVGKFQRDGILYQSIRSLERDLAVSERTLRIRIASAGQRIRKVEVANTKGKNPTYYATEDVRVLCTDLLESGRARSGQNVAGVTWVALDKAVKDLGVDRCTVTARLMNGQVRTRDGYDAINRRCTLYAFEDIFELMRSYLATPQVSPGKLVSIDGEKWGAQVTIARRCGVVEYALSAKIAEGVIRSRSARNRGKLCKIYNLPDALRVFAAVQRRRRNA